jgi:hypothetical protein
MNIAEWGSLKMPVIVTRTVTTESGITSQSVIVEGIAEADRVVREWFNLLHKRNLPIGGFDHTRYVKGDMK